MHAKAYRKSQEGKWFCDNVSFIYLSDNKLQISIFQTISVELTTKGFGRVTYVSR